MAQSRGGLVGLMVVRPILEARVAIVRARRDDNNECDSPYSEAKVVSRSCECSS